MNMKTKNIIVKAIMIKITDYWSTFDNISVFYFKIAVHFQCVCTYLFESKSDTKRTSLHRVSRKAMLSQ